MTPATSPPPLSIAIITKNEEERLADCLRSVSFAQEIIVIDSGSTDNTVDIAKTHGARVFIEEWQGFSAQKQLAVDHCQNDWVLIVDADERIPAKTAHTISTLIQQENHRISAYSFRRKNYLHGRWIKYCGWWPNPVVRLVDKRKGSFDGRAVHESWQTAGTIEGLEAEIDHLSFRNYSELISSSD